LHTKLQLSDLVNELEKPPDDISVLEERLAAFNPDTDRFVNQMSNQVQNKLLLLALGFSLLVINAPWVLSWWESPTFWIVLGWLLLNAALAFFIGMFIAIILEFIPLSRWLVLIFYKPGFVKNVERARKENESEISHLKHHLKHQKKLHTQFFGREREISNNAKTIVSHWGYVMTKHDTVNRFFDVKFLPHDKEVITKAIQMMYSKTSDSEKRDALKVSLMSLSHFQENIGLEPIFDKGAVLKKASDWILEDEQKIELVAELESKLDPRLRELHNLAKSDTDKLLASLS
jgi:hypothetical protein